MACTLIIKVVDTSFTDPEHIHLNKYQYDVGDVISVHEFKADVGKKMPLDPRFKIIHCPDLDIELAREKYLAGSEPEDPVNPDPEWRKRNVGLQFDRMDAATKDAITLERDITKDATIEAAKIDAGYLQKPLRTR